LIEFNVQRLPALPPGRMLEIGCASGCLPMRLNEITRALQAVEDGAS
jgi:hypothetical protein